MAQWQSSFVKKLHSMISQQSRKHDEDISIIYIEYLKLESDFDHMIAY